MKLLYFIANYFQNTAEVTFLKSDINPKLGLRDIEIFGQIIDAYGEILHHDEKKDRKR